MPQLLLLQTVSLQRDSECWARRRAAWWPCRSAKPPVYDGLLVDHLTSAVIRFFHNVQAPKHVDNGRRRIAGVQSPRSPKGAPGRCCNTTTVYVCLMDDPSADFAATHLGQKARVARATSESAAMHALQSFETWDFHL